MKKLTLLITLFLLIIMSGGVWIFINYFSDQLYTSQPITGGILTPRISSQITSTTIPSPSLVPSRAWMVLAEESAQTKKLPPTSAARLLAYVATVYHETLRMTNDPEFANAATRSLLLRMYPDTISDTNISKLLGDTFNPLAFSYLYDTTTSSLLIPPSTESFLDTPHREALEWLEQFFLRERTDGFYNQTPLKITTNLDSWKNVPLTTPRAGEWQRWIISPTTDLKIPSPSASGSAAYQNEEQKVITALKNRTPMQDTIIQTWVSNSNGNSPAILWQEYLWKEHIATSSTVELATDLAYAEKQKLLAQALADTYMIAWETKFTYWRSRPILKNSGLSPALSIPSSPSYLSEDAAVATVAQELLSKWFPDRKETFSETAERIKTALLSSGIHFELDINEGSQLGEKISALIPPLQSN